MASMSVMHPAQRRYLAEDLIRRRRSDEQRRYASPQRAAKVDANPHQIQAVIFALARVREGGCILADEVGLGKTIEAGLVIAQLMAEGAKRILLITPKPLLGQWKQELFQLFDIDAREGQPRIGGFDGLGVFLIGREAAGSENGRAALLASQPFDLCVIDEAHEVFAGIYKRFDAFGQYKEDAAQAQTAGRVRDVLFAGRTPVLLLTATPIQNGLTELWGLVQYVDPLGTLLGDLPTFREVFCGPDDRQLAPGQEEELRSRLRVVVQRTLRRDAQEFLEKPFVQRQARLFEYTMSPAEKALYDDVTRYLLEPGIVAFQGRQRQLLLLGYHRRMASSMRALAASLEKLAARLRRRFEGAETQQTEDEDIRSVVEDLEGEGLDDQDDHEATDRCPDPDKLQNELRRVEGFIQRAEALRGDDSKFSALLKALHFVTQRASTGQGSGKLVIFTESRVTQDYLRDRLVESGFVNEAEITLFRGTNDSQRAQQALERWRMTVPQGKGNKANTDMQTRLALVYEFQTRSRVFISTEAGAKGLNLQFCNTIVNYDLPWNPQRIEQRIGRCHRYGQRHDVTVINFLAKDNEAQCLTFEILSQKLELFGTILDASDQVLHRPNGSDRGVLISGLGADFEAELRRIYERARTIDEVTAELRALRDKVAEQQQRVQQTHARTADLIETRFDEGVQRVFRLHKQAVPAALAQLDQHLLDVVLGYLDERAIPYKQVDLQDTRLLEVGPSMALPHNLGTGMMAAIGPSKAYTSLHPNHPLVLAAVADARATSARMSAVVKLPSDAPEALRNVVGKRGCLRLIKLSFDGFEQIERLIAVLVLEDGQVIDASLADVLFQGTFRDSSAPLSTSIGEDMLGDAVEEARFTVQIDVDAAEHRRFERALQQVERYMDDRLLVLHNRRQVLVERLEQAKTRREGATGSAARTDAERSIAAAQSALDDIDGTIIRLQHRDDKTFQNYQEHIHQRRYTPPRVERIFDLEVVIE